MTVTRVVVADDHELVAEGLFNLLEKQPDLEVCAVAKDGREAFDKAKKLRPDLVIMDISMPGLNGIEACDRITAELDRVRVLCLSMHAEAPFVEAALKAGASGYLHKNSTLEELLRAIQIIMAGSVYLSPEVTSTVIDVLKSDRPLASATAFDVLTDREREVLQLLAEGSGTREISSRLHMSPKTVATHREHIMGKLHIHSIAGLTKYAICEGLTAMEPDYDPET